MKYLYFVNLDVSFRTILQNYWFLWSHCDQLASASLAEMFLFVCLLFFSLSQPMLGRA